MSSGAWSCHPSSQTDRRARKLKEANGLTELKKQQNRVEFGKAEEEASAFDETVGLGMMNAGSSGRVRAHVAGAASKGACAAEAPLDRAADASPRVQPRCRR